jgi:hypothetical protein
MIHEGDCGVIGGANDDCRGNRRTRRKPAPVPLCPTTNPHDQVRFRTPDRSDGTPATNRLSYGAAFCVSLHYTSSVCFWYSAEHAQWCVSFDFFRCTSSLKPWVKCLVPFTYVFAYKSTLKIIILSLMLKRYQILIFYSFSFLQLGLRALQKYGRVSCWSDNFLGLHSESAGFESRLAYGPSNSVLKHNSSSR